MATKQGLTAQLSQASEDAKRAVLQRSTAVIKSSSQWFSNLNTTCTIKSAPPRTPDVLQMLSVKSGFLYKRNEQHVWQARWCCVVPHMFLYYFDAVPLPQPRSTGGTAVVTNTSSTTTAMPQQQQQQLVVMPPPPPSLSQQDAWNNAVRYGYDGGRGKQGPRSSLYHVFPTNAGVGGGGGVSNSTATPTTTNPMTNSSISIIPEGSSMATSMMMTAAAASAALNDDSVPTTSSSSSSLPTPAGIIDLECYSSVHRSSQNPLVLELAGDDAVNPDLRGFYFCARDEYEAEDWTQALLSQRHSQLLDERDAYQQVCDGFALQLQEMHSQLDICQVDLEQAREEVYSVRCQMEDQRRSCWKLVEEALEQQQQHHHQQQQYDKKDDHHHHNSSNRMISLNLEEIRSQDGSALASVQLLLDYTKSLEETCAQLQQANVKLQQEKETAQQVRLQQDDHSEEKAQLQAQLQHEQSQFQRLQEAYQSERLIWQQDTAAQKATLQQYKSKLKEMHSHKKILKREVIELRKKCEEMESEVNLLQHRHGKELQHEQGKLELLERYLAKMESQVKVQQNMMELMSSSMSYYGGGSQYVGGEGGGGSANMSLRGGPPELPRSIVAPRVYPSAAAIATHDQEEEEENANDNTMNTTLASDGVAPKKQRNDQPEVDHDQEQQQQQQLGRSTAAPAAVTSSTTNHALPLTLPPTPRRIPPPPPLSTEQQQQHQRELDETYHLEEDDFKRTNYTPPNNLASSTLADDMDNKSHLSELTEDRTQRQFDFVFHHRQQHQQQQDAAETKGSNTTNARHNSGSSPTNAAAASRNHSSSALGGPPSYIMGGTEKSAALSSSQQQQPPPHHPHLDTITSRAAATSNNSSSPSSPTRGNVVHRARLDADNKAIGAVKLRTPFVPTNSSPKKVHARSNSAISVSSNNTNASPRGDRSIATTGSFLSNLGKRLEQALDNSILGVPDISTGSSLQSKDFYDDDDEEEEEEENDHNLNSFHRNRAVFEEKKLPEDRNLNATSSNDNRSQPASSLTGMNVSSSRLIQVTVDAAMAAATAVATSPKSKSPANQSNLSLQERQKLQRAKQLAFLKQQGIIQKDDEVRGGAGNTGSVSSSPSTWIDSTVSLATTASNPSTSTPSVQHRLRKVTGSQRTSAR